jgi:hypothetical protein
MIQRASSEKKAYAAPQLRKWGTLIDLTATGCTHPGVDIKGGSITWSQAQNDNGGCK